MSKLTHGDIQDLTTFFASPLSVAFGHGLAAQTYEPRGKAGYDPSTDSKLASMVVAGIRHGKNAWAQMKRVVDQLSDAHVEVLRLLCRSGRESVACRMPRALEAGRRLAEEVRRLEHLEHDRQYAMGYLRLSPIATAAYVLEADRRFVPREVSQLELLSFAHNAIAAELVDVAAETDALLDAAGSAFHAARAEVASWRRSTSAREDQRRAAFRAQLDEERAVKERAKFERRLRAAS